MHVTAKALQNTEDRLIADKSFLCKSKCDYV